MGAMRFSNQRKDEILRHLAVILREGTYYNLSSDPLCIHFEVRESNFQPHEKPERQFRQWDRRRDMRRSGTRKRVRPKIRSVKKGRTVNLKGVVY